MNHRSRSQLGPITSAEPRPSKRRDVFGRGFVNAPKTELGLRGLV